MTFVKSDALLNAVLSDTHKYFSRYQESLLEKGIYEWPDQTLQQRASISLRQALLKKYMPDANSILRADSAALDKFLQINSDCESVTVKPETLLEECILSEMSNIIYDFWYTNSDRTRSLEGHPFDSLARGRMGPGASLGVLGNDFYTKMFSSTLTSTSDTLIKFYQVYSSKQPIWSEAERLRSSIYGLPRVIHGNRLAFVPKSTEISRTICTEPSLNMFYQLGFGRLLEQRLTSYFGIDVATEPEHNRELARIGSISGRLGTIDLSSASDSLSLNMLRKMLPPSFMERLMLYRSPLCELPSGVKIPLQMVSTMGNGFTFPLQTMLFASAVCAVYKVLDLPRQFSDGQRTWGVFGDDIVCLKQAFNQVTRVLHILGFKVNADKTFNEGLFRESCGCDYYLGNNVRGVYVKDLSTELAHYVTFNRLNIFSARTNIFLPTAVKLLFKGVRFLPVPEWENDSAGFRLPLFLLDKVSRNRNLSYIYYRNQVRPSYLVFGDAEVRQSGGGRKIPRIYNPDGALISFLIGGIVNNKVGLRTSNTSWSRRRSVAPSWEMTEGDAANAGVVPARWRTACRVNVS